MSERITIVVPDGTKEKIKAVSKQFGQTQSAFSRKIILDGLKLKVANILLSNDLGGGNILSDNCKISLPQGMGGMILQSHKDANGNTVVTQFQLNEISL